MNEDTLKRYIFGILSSVLRVRDLIEKYPGKIIVDCDTNEIFGAEENEPFFPEKNSEEISIKKKKDDFPPPNNFNQINNNNDINFFNFNDEHLNKNDNFKKIEIL